MDLKVGTLEQCRWNWNTTETESRKLSLKRSMNPELKMRWQNMLGPLRIIVPLMSLWNVFFFKLKKFRRKEYSTGNWIILSEAEFCLTGIWPKSVPVPMRWRINNRPHFFISNYLGLDWSSVTPGSLGLCNARAEKWSSFNWRNQTSQNMLNARPASLSLSPSFFNL